MVSSSSNPGFISAATQIADGIITGAKLVNATLTNTQISGAAAIALSKLATLPFSSLVQQTSTIGVNFSTTSSTLTDSGLTVTLAASSLGGFVLANLACNPTAASVGAHQIVFVTVTGNGFAITSATSSVPNPEFITMSSTFSAGAGTVKLQVKGDGTNAEGVTTQSFFVVGNFA